jgi:hypothetical protein
MPQVDLDFRRYVERRKGLREAEAREGAAYGYSGDLKILRTLDRLRPVRLALEATVRLWRGAARNELLGGAVQATRQKEAKAFATLAECADRLHIGTPTLYVLPDGLEGARAFGTNEEPCVVVGGATFASLSEPEQLALLGRACGAIQNHHVLFATALHYLKNDAGRFLRWSIAPAGVALDRWARRAEITLDRAGLLCARDLAATEALLRKLLVDDPNVEKRVAALRIFAETSYYLGVTGQTGGINQSTCDGRVADALK